MNRLYRWGILGAGKIAAKFASALNYTEGAKFYAVASRDKEKAEDFAETNGATRIYDDYYKLVTDPEVDIIYIATPHAFHCEQTLLCLENKKPVLCEKPMALNESQVKQMVEASRANQTFLMEGMWSRFMPSVINVWKIISEKAIGDVQYIKADFGFQAPYDPKGRLFDLKLGGGSLLDVGIYPIFLTSLLFGEPSQIKSVAKLSATGADEYTHAVFQYPGGQTASIFSSITIKTSLTAEIAGTKGRIYMHNPWYKTKDITVELNDDESNDFSFPYEHNGFEYEIRHVNECLDKGLKESPLMPFDFSLLMSRTMDKIREQVGVKY